MCKPNLQACLFLPGEEHTLATLQDSGANANHDSQVVGTELDLEKVPLSIPVPARARDRHSLRIITHQT